MLTLTAIAAGRGADYLINSVGRENELVHEIDDAAVAAYFDAATREGEPAGRWMGSLAERWELGGQEVGRDELRRLFGHGRHPVTGELMGRAPRSYRPLEERLAAVEARAEAEGWDAEKIAETLVKVRIAGDRVARTGYDCTFTAPKSVSLLFGLSPDEGLRQAVLECHEEAVTKAVEWIDGTALTRVGADGIRQVDATGVAAAAFTHRTSRAGDPHLHTHVALAAKVQASTGRWLAIDGRGLWLRAATIRNVYEGELMSLLTERCGVAWERRSKTGVMEVQGCSEELIQTFSKRGEQIDADLESHDAPAKGEPGFKEAHRASWYRTRARKQEGQTTISLGQRWRMEAGGIQPLAATEMTENYALALPVSEEQWDELVARAGIADPGACVESIAAEASWAGNLEAGDWKRLGEALDATVPERRVLAALALVSAERSTWTESHVAGAVKRVIEAHPRLAWLGPDDAGVVRGQRIDVPAEIAATTTEILSCCRRLTPGDPAGGAGPVRSDGRSVYEHVGQVRYTTEVRLEVERRVLGMAMTPGAVTFTKSEALVVAAGRLDEDGVAKGALSSHQARVLAKLLGTDARLRVLVGPAGTGKTTVMRALVDAYGARGLSVVGLAPYQVAAHELAESTGMETMNLARFLSPKSEAAKRLYSQLRPGSLVVLDEAGTATSDQMHALVRIATERGCDLLFLGDHEQLPAIGAGGLFADLAASPGACELGEVHRFRDGEQVRTWEATASLQLRTGDVRALAAYEGHGRIHAGGTQDIEAEVVRRSVADRLAGKMTLVLAPTEAQAEAVSAAVQHRLMTAGVVDHTETVKVRGGARAGVGDQIQTRRNDHDKGIANRDVWTVAKVHPNRSVTVVGADGQRAHLTPDYVREDVSLAYAGTIHAAQGATVDTCRVLVDRATPSAALYVGMTRGRLSNEIFVATDTEGYDRALTQDPVAILGERMRAGDDNAGSAHTTAARQDAEYRSLSWLVPVMVDLEHGGHTGIDVQSAVADADVALSRVIRASAGWDPLVRYVADLERAGWDVREAVRSAVAGRSFGDVAEPAAVLHYRLYCRFGEAGDVYASAPGVLPPTPAASREEWCLRMFGPAANEAQAQLRSVIHERIVDLGARAVADGAQWVAEIPGDGLAHQAAVEAVAAYRDLSGYEGSDPIGPRPALGQVSAVSAWRVAHDTLRYASVPHVPSAPTTLVAEAPRVKQVATEPTPRVRAILTAAVAAGEAHDPALDTVTPTRVLYARRVRDEAAVLSPAVREKAEAAIARLREQTAEAQALLLALTLAATRNATRGLGPDL